MKHQYQCSQEQCDLISTVVCPIIEKLHEFIVGQHDPITRVVLSLLAVGQCGINPVTKKSSLGSGHILFIGPTGTGKTELCKLLAVLVGGQHKRLACVPDLLPSDVTGYEMLSIHASETHVFRPGPVFANILLADEVNRMSPKAASGLLQAMAEGIVTYSNTTHILPQPFLCLATMNPSEQAGTFQMNEALSDRFMFTEWMTDSTISERVTVARRVEKALSYDHRPVTDLETIVRAREYIHTHISVSEEILLYCGRLLNAINHPRDYGLFKDELRSLAGSSLFRQDPPLSNRAMIFLQGAAKAQAAIRYRDYVTFDDVRAILPAVLRSRLSLITDSASYTLVGQEGDTPYRSRQELITHLIDQALERVPIT